jgi:ABC-type sugar transport system permease subunit
MSDTSTQIRLRQPVGTPRRRWRLTKDQQMAWLFVLPAFLIIFVLILGPIARAAWMSVHIIDLKRPALGQPFVGLENYIKILQDPYFWDSIGRTMYFLVVSIAVEMVLGISIALLLNRRFWGRSVLRAIILVPWALPITIDAVMWKWIFNANYGALNALLTQLGLAEGYRAWLSNPATAMNTVIVADVWKVTPLVVLLGLAALQTIPPSLYEAAVVDGANRWKSFWRITLPLMMPQLLIVLLVRSMDAFRVFDIIYIMTSGGPADSTKVISYFTYLEAFSYLRQGRAAALTYLMTFFIAILAFIYIRLLNREVEY